MVLPPRGAPKLAPVFEQHLPETAVLSSAGVAVGSTVLRRKHPEGQIKNPEESNEHDLKS
jgi:hypothetical protein